MRVAFVDIEDPQDLSNWSGIPYFILQEFRRQGVEVEVVAPLNRPFKYRFVPRKIVAKLSGKSVQINRRPIALRSFASQISKRIQGRNCDVIFSTSSIPISQLPAGAPVLYWVDAVSEAMAGYYAGAFANVSDREIKIAHEQEQAALDRASYAIYSSDWAAQSVKKFYDVPQDKLQVIEFGANLPIDHDENQVIQFNQLRLRSECILLFIGVDWERKGGSLAFEAARLLNERGVKTVLKVVGGGGPEASFVEKLGFIDKKTAEGRQRIKDLLASSTFFILPTRAEAAGIVFSEASAFGLPAITTKTGGVESYVIDSETGYCLPMSAGGAEYADRIAQTLASSVTYNRLSTAAFRYYKQKLNWTVGVRSVLSLAQRAMSNEIRG